MHDRIDGVLFDLCARHGQALERRLACSAVDDDAGWEREIALEDDLADEIEGIAPRTLEGLHAKAAVARAVLQREGSDDDFLNPGERFSKRLIKDVLSLAPV